MYTKRANFQNVNEFTINNEEIEIKENEKVGQVVDKKLLHVKTEEYSDCENYHFLEKSRSISVLKKESRSCLEKNIEMKPEYKSTFISYKGSLKNNVAKINYAKNGVDVCFNNGGIKLTIPILKTEARDVCDEVVEDKIIEESF